MGYPGYELTGMNLRPLKNSTYGMATNVNFTYIKPPSMTDSESYVVGLLSQTSTQFNNAFAAPGVQ